MSINKHKNESKPYIKFLAKHKSLNNKGDFDESDQIVLIPLDTSFGTLDHIQRYAGKEGWVYHSHANLDPNNEEHTKIVGFINAIKGASGAYRAAEGIKAKLEKKQREVDANG